jgi:hypothetical protein
MIRIKVTLAGICVLVFLVLAGVVLAAPPAPKVYTAHLDGSQEVPERETPAQGQAVMKIAKDGQSIEYILIVANIQNVTAAHIHVGSAVVNGPVVVWLYGPAAPGGGRTDGVLATGVITADDLVGPLAGATLQDLIDQMNDGLTYVNVHTSDGSGPENAGPGNFPTGEVRGQLRANGPKK